MTYISSDFATMIASTMTVQSSFLSHDVPADNQRCLLHVPHPRVQLHQLHWRFQRGDTPDRSTQAFTALGDLFTSLGLQSSPDKDSANNIYGLHWSPTRYPCNVNDRDTRPPARTSSALFFLTFLLPYAAIYSRSSVSCPLSQHNLIERPI